MYWKGAWRTKQIAMVFHRSLSIYRSSPVSIFLRSEKSSYKLSAWVGQNPSIPVISFNHFIFEAFSVHSVFYFAHKFFIRVRFIFCSFFQYQQSLQNYSAICRIYHEPFGKRANRERRKREFYAIR